MVYGRITDTKYNGGYKTRFAEILATRKKKGKGRKEISLWSYNLI